MPVQSIAKLYDLIKSGQLLGEDSISFLLNYFKTLTPEQKNLLIEHESQHISVNEVSLMFSCFSTLTDILHKENFDANKYNNVKTILKKLLEVLPFELTNNTQKNILLALAGNAKNLFGLCLQLMATFNQRMLDAYKPEYRELANEWLNEICIPLMKCNPDVDASRHFIGNTNLILGCKFNVPTPYFEDPLCTLVNYILSHGQQINTPNNCGQTPLYIYIDRKFPAEYLRDLINKGADVNSKCSIGIGGGDVRIPLLSHCIKSKNYVALNTLLENGADPNAMPEKEQYYVSSNKNNESLITPYQLAVAMSDEQAIACFVKFSNSTGKSLTTDLLPGTTHWTTNMGNSKLQVTGVSLSLACRTNLFETQDSLILSLQQRFGIRCHVANPKDRENVTKSLTWLATDALTSPISFIWKPMYECLIKQMQENPEFKIYVSSTPQELNKSCAGLLHGNEIHAMSGLSVDSYKSVFAHEAAHLFDKVNIGIVNSMRMQWNDKAEEFLSAFKADKELDKSKFGVNNFSSDIQALYSSDFSKPEPVAEYFAYLFIDNIFSEHFLFQTRATEREMMQKTQENMPNLFAWYKKHFMQDRMELRDRKIM